MSMDAYQKDGVFYFPVRVFYEDTDAGGVVYHSNFYKYGERARSEWLRFIGVPRERLEREYGIMFVARRATIEWRKPARLDDLLMVETRLISRGKVRMHMRHTVMRDGVMLADIEIEMVCINMQFVPTALPEELMKALPAAPRIEEKK